MKRGEFELINDFVKAFPRPRAPLALGPGDDCALLRPQRGEELVLTVDAVVEGVHFTKRFRPEEIGHKALAVNLSDLAAMGAKPVAFLVAIAMPERWLAKLPGIARGMARLAKRHGCQLAGGNMSRARELSITVTAMGAVPRGRALLRSGARPGDSVARLRRARRSGCWPSQVDARPARASAHARAADCARPARTRRGPRGDRHLRRARPGPPAHAARVEGGRAARRGRIPVERGATLKNALSGGEDYELLLAVPPKRVARLRQAARQLGVSLTDIGWVTQRVGLAGASKAMAGHDHFRSRN